MTNTAPRFPEECAFTKIAYLTRRYVKRLRELGRPNVWQTRAYQRQSAIDAIEYAVHSCRVSGELVMWIRSLSVQDANALVRDFADRRICMGDAAHELNKRFYGVGSLERGE
jgi:hypothetical protein